MMPLSSAKSDKYALSLKGNSTPPTPEIIIMPLSPAHGRGLCEQNVGAVPLPEANTPEMPGTGLDKSPDGSFDTSVDGISTPQTLTHTTSLLDDSDDQKDGSGECSPDSLDDGEMNVSGPTSELNQLGLLNGADERPTEHQVTLEQPEPPNGKVVYHL
jgi:hypothetical protein